MVYSNLRVTQRTCMAVNSIPNPSSKAFKIALDSWVLTRCCREPQLINFKIAHTCPADFYTFTPCKPLVMKIYENYENLPFSFFSFLFYFSSSSVVLTWFFLKWENALFARSWLNWKTKIDREYAVCFRRLMRCYMQAITHEKQRGNLRTVNQHKLFVFCLLCAVIENQFTACGKNTHQFFVFHQSSQMKALGLLVQFICFETP